MLTLVGRHRDPFDEVATPRLLHSDLELHHVLVDRGRAGTRIVGLIDHELAQWGRPTGESLLIRLTLAPPPGWEPFWETYGHLPEGTKAEFRRITYQSIGQIVSTLDASTGHPAEANAMGTQARIAPLEDRLNDIEHRLAILEGAGTTFASSAEP